MSIKCVLFDAGGVMVNSEPFSILYSKKYGISNDEMLPFFKGEFGECLVGKADLMDVVEPWLSKWNWNGTVEEFLESWFNLEHFVDKQIVEVIDSLKEKNIICCLAADQEKYRTEYMINEMGFSDIFDEMFVSSKLGHKKSEKEFYEFTLRDLKERYNIEPEEIMFFDDDQKNIDKANELGIKAFLYENFEGFKSVLNLHNVLNNSK